MQIPNGIACRVDYTPIQNCSPFIEKYCGDSKYLPGDRYVAGCLDHTWGGDADILCLGSGSNYRELFRVCEEGSPPPAPVTNITPDNQSNSCGSIIYTDTQVLSESIALTGIPYSLVYSSNKVPGHKVWYKASIPLSSSDFSSPSVIDGLTLSTTIAGQAFSTTLPPSADLYYDFVWDGKDQNGNPVHGSKLASYTVGTSYVFTVEYPYEVKSSVILGSVFGSNYGLGGWDFDVHHHYDEVRKVLYLGDGSSFNTGSVSRSNGERWVVSKDRSEVYIFDTNNRHIQTKNALTGIVKLTFNYTSNKLTSIADAFSNITTIQYSGNNVSSITSPYGQVTTISSDSNGYIASVTNPASEDYEMTYTTEGLLLTFEKPSGVISTMTYDSDGKLLTDISSAGSSVSLARTNYSPTNYVISETSALGRIKI